MSVQSQSQTPQDKNTTMQNTKPQSFEDISIEVSPKSADNEFKNAGSFDKYKNYITKKFGKDAKEVLSIYNETKHIKEIIKILESQSNEISNQFQGQIQSLADDIITANSETNPQMIAFKKIMIGKSIQIYYKFLGIENILKIQCKNLELTTEYFELKSQLLNSTDFFVSLIQNAKVSVKIHPLIPDEVKGDVLKFREILTAMFNFIFKCTKVLELEVDLDEDHQPESYNVILNFSFTPKFNINEEIFKILNNSNANMFLFEDKHNNLKFFKIYDKVRDTVCLSFMMIPSLIKSMGGSIKSAGVNNDKSVSISFLIPFNSVPSSQKKHMTSNNIRFGSTKEKKEDGYIFISPENS